MCRQGQVRATLHASYGYDFSKRRNATHYDKSIVIEREAIQMQGYAPLGAAGVGAHVASSCRQPQPALVQILKLLPKANARRLLR